MDMPNAHIAVNTVLSCRVTVCCLNVRFVIIEKSSSLRISSRNLFCIRQLHRSCQALNSLRQIIAMNPGASVVHVARFEENAPLSIALQHPCARGYVVHSLCTSFTADQELPGDGH